MVASATERNSTDRACELISNVEKCKAIVVDITSEAEDPSHIVYR